MKMANEWAKEWGFTDSPGAVDFIEKIQRDALEAAAQACDNYKTAGWADNKPDYWLACLDCARVIREGLLIGPTIDKKPTLNRIE